MKLLLFILILNCLSLAKASDVENLKAMGKAFSSIAKRTSPAVVFIKTEKKQAIGPQWQFFSPFNDMNDFPFGDDLFKRFFKKDIPNGKDSKERFQKVLGQGSGFIFSNDGLILTNNHVVGDADKVTVKLLDGRSFVAEVIGADKPSDIAIIKIKAKNLTSLPLGDSSQLEVGEWVLALGNPFGLSHSLTAGIVSAKGRSSVGITNYENFIQTDAAINLGNSGGPLINLDGNAVGMNTAIFSSSGGSVGIGFAIPINMIIGIKDQLIKTGKVIRGYVGILIQDLTEDLAEQFNIKGAEGILISDISEDSPAKKSGLKIGDVIIKYDGNDTKDVGTFRNLVALTPPGKLKTLVVVRNGKEKEIKVRIGHLPSKVEVSKSENFEENNFGFSVDNLNSTTGQRFGIPPSEKGVVVSAVDPNSVAAMAGVRPGLVIKEVNRIEINSVTEFKKAAKKYRRKGSILLLVQDGEFTRYITLSLN